MLRTLFLGIAVVAGLGAALLLGGAPTVHYDGQSASCGSPIAEAYTPDVADEGATVSPPRSDHAAYVDQRLSRLCDQQQGRWTALAGLGALVSVLAATGAQVRREQDLPVADAGVDAEPALR